MLHRGVQRWWMIALAGLLVFVWQPGGASALDCAVDYNPEEAYQSYDGIVLAKVERAGPAIGSADTRVRIIVERSFKGIQQERMHFWEDSFWGTGSAPSEKGKRYLFFLNKTAGGWKSQLCSPSMNAADAGSMLAYLADYELPITETGTARDPGWLLFGGIVLVVGLMASVTFLIRGRRRGTSRQ
ncbi:hypothetical protein [Paenibacillus sp. 1P07SE]|uniref:hypothetical protein n=1 Tax=Paenibacillus sp. 1P07SE TaxID=3132209 RepID=UPI0039A65D93